MHDLAGNCVEKVTSPRTGTVGILRTFASAQPRDLLVQIFYEIGQRSSRMHAPVR